jgi:predicted enzyme related to lactoylglutathione lyase
MQTTRIAAVMVHVGDVRAGLAWYRRAFPEAVEAAIPGVDAGLLQVAGVQIEIVPADGKVPSGAAGSVVCWQVPAFESALASLLSLGAVLYRGPLQIEDGLSMCQVQDPWGNCIGIRGPSAKP